MVEGVLSFPVLDWSQIRRMNSEKAALIQPGPKCRFRVSDLELLVGHHEWPNASLRLTLNPEAHSRTEDLTEGGAHAGRQPRLPGGLQSCTAGDNLLIYFQLLSLCAEVLTICRLWHFRGTSQAIIHYTHRLGPIRRVRSPNPRTPSAGAA